VRAPNDILFIEDTLSQAPEKPRHAVLEDLTARTEQGGRWIELAPKREHVVFVPAGSMEQQESSGGRPFRRGDKTMDEVHRALIQNKERRFSNRRIHKMGGFKPPLLEAFLSSIGYTGTILMYIWRKRVGAHWLQAENEEFTRRFGAALAVVERPGSKRALLEICCRTKKEAQALTREFGGDMEKLRPGWLRHFAKQASGKPLRIGSRLTILSAPAQQTTSTRALIIPAEAAFGTGHHATTAMCLRLLERITRRLAPGWRMIDAGTGSGILALTGSCFGAGEVLAIDNDPLACATAKRNARANRVRGIEFSTGDILNQKLRGEFEIITANLFSELLIEALPNWTRHLAPGGQLIISGILRSQEAAVVRALRRQGFTTPEVRRRGKWIALLACWPGQKGS